ncbi:aluminum-activated, malate transporter 12, quick-activating anion channel 1 [Hibiscus trionum]|uniref:Aluminum-activated, malate transporter 12, quick-activating anion channel 1 n=1 Tax=Hibiscus trionum TaxID=183268 RepID=A0A9W7J0T3_HIBTR|nr:aluminum-activated, malate transporter 12, quick-activating anion channel 1 [Hibiscus trionum]
MATRVHVGMETEMNGNGETDMVKNNWKERLVEFSGKVKRFPGWLWRTIWKVGREDPRRLIHAVKVGLSLTLVSLLYLMEPLFKGIGTNAIWAVMTVVVVLEFTAGATLCKGLNRGLGTLLAGSLAFFIEFIATRSGKVFRAVFIGVAVFLIGTASTYMRFFPYIKKNYDYGVVIFLLTFNLITVSSYRIENVLKIAHDRFYTIAIGCVICLFMSLMVFPIWSGEDLHNSTVRKLEGLAKSIEACVNEYFNDSEIKENQEKSSEDPIYKGYKAVLDSKSTDETLALYASWEPRHSKHCYRFPWQQYVKVGAVLRQFGYTVVALHGCLQTEIQAPRSVRILFKDPCIRLAREVTKALMELANSLRNRRHCSPEILSDHLHEALQDLNTAIKSQPRLFLGSNNNQATNMLALAAAHAAHHNKQEKDSHGVSISSVKTDSSALREWKSKRVNEQAKENERKVLRPQLSKIAITSLEFSEALPFAAFASLLVEMVARLDNVIEEVEELGRVGCYKEYNPEEDEIVVKCEKPPVDVTKNQLPTHASD